MAGKFTVGMRVQRHPKWWGKFEKDPAKRPHNHGVIVSTDGKVHHMLSDHEAALMKKQSKMKNVDPWERVSGKGAPYQSNELIPEKKSGQDSAMLGEHGRAGGHAGFGK